MHSAGKLLRGLGLVLGVLALSFIAVLAVLQTQLGKAWLAREIGQTLGDPDFTIAMEGLTGFVPFNMTVERIDIGDRDGTYLTLRDAGLDISAAALLTGKSHIRSLTIAEVDMTQSSNAPSTPPFLDYLKVPHLPIPVELDRLSIGKLALAPPVLGENILATVEASH
jgi:translocation and assembly module TamB